MPAVVENVLAGQPALAGKRDRGDAEARQVGDGVAEVAEFRHDHRQMPAADGAVGDARHARSVNAAAMPAPRGSRQVWIGPDQRRKARANCVAG